MGAVRAPTRAKANPAGPHHPLELRFHDVFQAYVCSSTSIHVPLLLHNLLHYHAPAGCWHHSMHLASCRLAATRVVLWREFIESSYRGPIGILETVLSILPLLLTWHLYLIVGMDFFFFLS